MRGVHKPNKKSFGFYWTKDEIELLRTSAERAGTDMSTFVKYLVWATNENNGVDVESLAAFLKGQRDKRTSGGMADA